MTDATDATTAALERAHARYAERRPRSQELFERAAVVFPGGSTRSVLDVSPFPFRVAAAEGAALTDLDGLTYVDLLGDYSAGLLGHDPRPVRDAVTAALERGWSYGGVHIDEVRFAEAVVARFPAIEQVRFTNSGTEANLMAIQLARHHTGRDRVAVADRAYHGGLLYFGQGGEALLAPFDYTRLVYNDLATVDLVDETIAVVLVEPMMGAAGCIAATDEYLAALRVRCDAVGALLVFDEVMTSRAAYGGAQSLSGVLPDLTTLGKYLAGGMTFGAFGGRSDLMGAFDPARGGTLTHGGTFNNNVVTMAAGAAADELLDERSLAELFARGERLRAALNDVFTRSGADWTATGMGSFLNLHPVPGPVSSPLDLDGAEPARRELLFHELLDRGWYIAPRGYLALSMAVTDEHVDGFVDAVGEVIPDLP